MKDVLMVFVVLMDFLFMPYTAGRAWKRGYPKWAWGAILTLIGSFVMMAVLFPEEMAWNNFFGILLLFSPSLVSIIAFRKTTKPVAPPAKCPECGESGAARGRVTLDQKTGEKVPAKLTGIILLFGGLCFFVLSLWFLWGVTTWDAPVPMPIGAASPIAVTFLIGCLLAGSSFKILTRGLIVTFEKMKYKCGACKHAWTQ